MTEIKASTQKHLDIEDILNDFVVLKTGDVIAVLETGAVNFDLLSEREQDAMIEAYSSLLNSLSFPVQVVVRSQKLDISSYLSCLRKAEDEEKSGSLKKHIHLYYNFVKELITKNDVLDKAFYVVVPHREIKISLGNPLQQILSSFRGEKETPKVVNPEEAIEAARPKLEPRIDHLIKQFARIGIQARRIKTEELIKIFYDIYN